MKLIKIINYGELSNFFADFRFLPELLNKATKSTLQCGHLPSPRSSISFMQLAQNNIHPHWFPL
jgi:hypothetical protein